MKSFSELMNLNFYEFARTSSARDTDDSKNSNSEGSKGVLAPRSTPLTERVSVSDLETAYKCGIIFNGVNKHVQHILSSKHYLWYYGDSVARDFFEEFMSNLGNCSDTVDWESFLYEIFKDCFAFGRFFCEKIFNLNKTRILDFSKIDPKVIDYSKDAQGNIVFDDKDRIVGYFVTYSYNSTIQSNPEDIPKDLSISTPSGGAYRYISAENIAQIKLFTEGNDLYPFGIIEPIYDDYLDFVSGKATLNAALNRFGEPTIITKVGDISHPPTPSIIKDTHDSIKKHRNDKLITTAYYNDVTISEAKDSFDCRAIVEFYKQNIKQGLWIPDVFGFEGSGSAIKTQASEFGYDLRAIVRKIVSQIRKYLFEPLCVLNGIDVVPTLVFEQLDPDEKDKKPKRISAYSKAGLITPDGKILKVKNEDDVII